MLAQAGFQQLVESAGVEVVGGAGGEAGTWGKRLVYNQKELRVRIMDE